jgi:hypothetical protein
MSVSRRIVWAIVLVLALASIGGCGARLFAKKSNAGVRQPDVSVPKESQQGESAAVDGQRQELNELLSIQ